MKLPNRWSLDCNYLLGLTLGEWWSLLRENRFAVDPAYLHRAAAITAMGAYNSALSAVEGLWYGGRLSEIEVSPPIFVIGHWRSGTTFLYQLLATDTRYCFPNAYQVVNPHSFLLSERLNSRLFGGLVPATRPPDNVALGFHLPEQDEYVLALASRCSPYIGHVFPENASYYERFVSMRGASSEERERFAGAHDELLRKLAFKYGRPAILKSPSHTARIALLRELYPEARFLFIHRDPFVVYSSTRRLYDTLHWYWYLQRPEPDSFEERILRRYVALHEAYLEDIAALGPGEVHEIAYADLVADPEGTLAGAYEALGMGDFDPALPALRERLASLEGYRTNRHPELEEGLKRRIAERWGPIYERWGYSP